MTFTYDYVPSIGRVQKRLLLMLLYRVPPGDGRQPETLQQGRDRTPGTSTPPFAFKSVHFMYGVNGRATAVIACSFVLQEREDLQRNIEELQLEQAELRREIQRAEVEVERLRASLLRKGVSGPLVCWLAVGTLTPLRLCHRR